MLGYYSSDEDFDVDWIWSHISDVRTDNDDSVILTVETPVGKAVFPYDLTHDTDAMFWELVEEAGGSLTDLRGMDVCIRERWWLSKEFRRKDIRNAGYSIHEYPSYDKECSQQPIQKPNDENKPTMIDDPTDVRPVGIDTQYVWTLVVPPHGRLYSQDTNGESGGDSESLIASLRSIF